MPNCASHKNYFNSLKVCISLSNLFLLSLGCQNNKSKNPSEVKTKKRGRPSLLPDELMTKVISMVKALHLKGAPVIAEVINLVAKGFIITSDWSLLIENGGYISLSNQWSRNVLYTMEQEGKATTEKIPVNPGLLKEAKLHFQ